MIKDYIKPSERLSFKKKLWFLNNKNKVIKNEKIQMGKRMPQYFCI
jgi:hypothetical protein